MLDGLRAHDLSSGFSWPDHRGPYRYLREEQVREFDENGFVVLESAIDATDLTRLIAEIDPLEEELEALLREADDGKIFIARADEITFTVHIVTRSAFVREFVTRPVFLGLAADLIGPDVRFYWDQAVYKKPGTQSPFPWHQDNGYTFLEPEPYLTCWIALTDATTENGCPWIVPGLHRRGTLAHELTDIGFVCLDPDGPHARSAVPVEAPAGSIVAFSSLTPHCTGANDTDATRKSYITQYAPVGAEMVRRDESGALVRELADHPNRQFVVLADGEAVASPPLRSSD
jgi:ectoine hydroxylase-related dioxygenase (phytanoyl-CoA dioxygenase family)